VQIFSKQEYRISPKHFPSNIALMYADKAELFYIWCTCEYVPVPCQLLIFLDISFLKLLTVLQNCPKTILLYKNTTIGTDNVNDGQKYGLGKLENINWKKNLSW